MKVKPAVISEQVSQALAEDIGPGDLTAGLVPQQENVNATVITRQPAVIAGQQWFDEVFRQLDQGIIVHWQCNDGDRVDENAVLCTLSGNARVVLSGERTALNFLQTLSAVATRTSQFVEKVAGTGVNILDTRKTIPGLRLAEKYAVTCGGGVNHRVGLYDAILIKENHIVAAGSISDALKQAQLLAPENTKIEIEVENLDEMQQAIDAGAKYLLLDNFSNDQLRQAVKLAAGKVRLEASGNVSLETVRDIALTGVDDISVGELTKHIEAIDLSMRFD